MAIEQWEFFSVPHLLWHGTSVYNGQLRGPVILTPIAESFAGELTLPFFTTWVSRSRDSNTQLSACEANALAHCFTAAVIGCILFWVTYKVITIFEGGLRNVGVSPLLTTFYLSMLGYARGHGSYVLSPKPSNLVASYENQRVLWTQSNTDLFWMSRNIYR